MNRFAISACAALLVGACTEEPAPVSTESDARAAEGDVLEGSISDAMLPLDNVQSKSPPAAASGNASGESSSDAGAEEESGV